MPDNWGFVAAAYGLTALVLGLYWHRLVRRENELKRTTTAPPSARPVRATASPVADTSSRVADTASRVADTASPVAERSREPSRSGHPRSEPASPPPLQQ